MQLRFSTEALSYIQPEINSGPELKEVSYKMFIFLLEQAISEVEGSIANFDNMASLISDHKEADFNIIYLADEHGNLGFKPVERKPMGFNTDVHSTKANPEIVEEVQEEDMPSVTRARFIEILLDIIDEHKFKLEYLHSQLSTVQIKNVSGFTIQCFINEEGIPLFIATEKKPMGFPGTV